ncbi:hypothetical protein [Lysinibacter cavernae]|uniref:hypothetical protein n=1 Tax=Lysinibacter cavernae TaxID=1640652 RepID=UPI003609D113
MNPHETAEVNEKAFAYARKRRRLIIDPEHAQTIESIQKHRRRLRVSWISFSLITLLAASSLITLATLQPDGAKQPSRPYIFQSYGVDQRVSKSEETVTFPDKIEVEVATPDGAETITLKLKSEKTKDVDPFFVPWIEPDSIDPWWHSEVRKTKIILSETWTEQSSQRQWYSGEFSASTCPDQCVSAKYTTTVDPDELLELPSVKTETATDYVVNDVYFSGTPDLKYLDATTNFPTGKIQFEGASPEATVSFRSADLAAVGNTSLGDLDNYLASPRNQMLREIDLFWPTVIAIAGSLVWVFFNSVGSPESFRRRLLRQAERPAYDSGLLDRYFVPKAAERSNIYQAAIILKEAARLKLESAELLEADYRDLLLSDESTEVLDETLDQIDSRKQIALALLQSSFSSNTKSDELGDLASVRQA